MANIIQFNSDASLMAFYGWWQLAVCLFAFLGLIAIWYHIGRKQGDFGQVWLALSILCWSISGGIDVYFSGQDLQLAAEAIQQSERNGQIDTSIFESGSTGVIRDGWRSILSLVNSLFILLALPWFRYLPEKVQPIISSRYWMIIVGLPFIFALLPTISSMVTRNQVAFISELDVYYATLTLIFLGWVLFESFAKRRLIFLAYLSILCILITFIAQLLKLSDSNVNLNLLSSIFKTSLIMIFFALALSWVKELAENVIPSSDYLFLSFKTEKKDNGKIQHKIGIRGLPGKEIRNAFLTPTVYNLFFKFALQRKENEGWLEIKPKSDSRSGKTYDIKDYNEVKRILTGLLDELFGKNNWTTNQHLEPLRSSLFEISNQRERKIRLKIPPNNITLEKGS